MESESPNSHPDQTIPETGDAESKMRRNLGLDGSAANGSPPSQSHDPLKAARQAIRSQVTAREYTERQLAQAQTAIQDLRTRMRHVHQEREAAVNAAQSAMMARDAAERTVRAAETALATERSTRARTEGMLRDAEATVRDLRAKLGTANQDLQTMRAEISAERQTRAKAEDAPLPAIAVHETVVATVRDAAVPIIRRPVGRPRKAAVGEAGQALMLPIVEPQVIPEDEAPSNLDSVAPTVRRPVGRPRKNAVVQPVEKLIRQRRNAQMLGKSVTKITSSRADDQEPVQWWVDGWTGR